MKKILLLSILFYCSNLINAKVVYLDNTKEKNATISLYNTFSDAYTACNSPGDTIYVSGAIDEYGSVSISKPIVIIGPGYFLLENEKTQVVKLTAKFSQITLATGSNGSIIKGVSLYDYGSYDRIYINNDVDDILIENCYLSRIFIDDNDGYIYDNIQIKKNYFWYGGIATGTGTYDNGIITNLVLTNNIFVGGLLLSNGSNGIISNNLFMSNTFDLGASSNFEIHNNILLADNLSDVNIKPLPDASVTHNISIINAFGTDNNNMELVNEGYLFKGSTDNSTDGQYQLAENSPAAGAGVGGIDAGPFGGSEPYRLSGLPDLPNIYELSTGGFVAGDELNVHIKAKQ